MKSEKLCECGCGEFTEVIPKNNTARGWVKGEPRRFVMGHARRKAIYTPPNPSGLCQCGCGDETGRSKTYSPPELLPGEFLRFVKGHEKRAAGPLWVEDINGCWIWQHGFSIHGYGTLRHEGRTTQAHRWVYVREVGPLAEDLHLHHCCERPACVNPAHLVPLTPSEHMRHHWEARRAA